MTLDFTIGKYRQLLVALNSHNDHRIRHDVDAHPRRALRIAQVEAAEGVKATYYFRSMHFAPYASLIAQVHALGHEVGYHYECLATTHGDRQQAYALFERELAELRRIAPVGTACAHGSPLSRWDSQSLWCERDIHALGIAYEPMLDTDFSRTLYLTDTGRRWDGASVSLRDKVNSTLQPSLAEGLHLHTTEDIIHALSSLHSPLHRCALLINTHTQRWVQPGLAWAAEAVAQPLKNIAKHALIKARQ